MSTRRRKKTKYPHYHCLRCGHEWDSKLPADKRPVRCPGCISPLWDRPRRNKTRKKGYYIDTESPRTGAYVIRNADTGALVDVRDSRDAAEELVRQLEGRPYEEGQITEGGSNG